MNEELKTLFIDAYIDWSYKQQNMKFTYAQVQDAWERYCVIRDAWMGIRPRYNIMPATSE